MVRTIGVMQPAYASSLPALSLQGARERSTFIVLLHKLSLLYNKLNLLHYYYMDETTLLDYV